MKKATKEIVLIAILLLVGITAYDWIVTHVLELSGIAVAVLRAATSAALFFLLVRVAGRGDDTLDEIKEGNTAAGLELLGYAIIIAAATLAS